MTLAVGDRIVVSKLPVNGVRLASARECELGFVCES